MFFCFKLEKKEKNMLILMVDDDALYFDWMKDWVPAKFKGAEFRFVLDGEQMKAMLKDVMPDVILMDAKFGKVVAGPDLVRGLRANGFIKPIIMISSDAGWNKDGIEAGANGVIDKIYIRHKLASVLQRLGVVDLPLSPGKKVRVKDENGGKRGKSEYSGQVGEYVEEISDFVVRCRTGDYDRRHRVKFNGGGEDDFLETELEPVE